MKTDRLTNELPEDFSDLLNGVLSDSRGGVATPVAPLGSNGLLELPTKPEGYPEGLGTRELTLIEKIEREYEKIERGEIDPKNKLEMVTLRHLERKYRRLTKPMARGAKRVHGTRKKNRLRRWYLKRGSSDIYTNWETLSKNPKLYHRWRFSFEDWMDVMEFIQAKWDVDEPWKETEHWRFRRHMSKTFDLKSTYIEDKREGTPTGCRRLLFCPYEFGMWKSGDLLL